MQIRFQAPDYTADGAFEIADYVFSGTEEDGWVVLRNGAPYLELGPGYRLLRTRECGICSTDLSRHFLPFPLPQVTGHELIALDEDGRRYVVEINASHAARGVESDCPFCRAGLERHCPERLVLGIHALPGGFGPWILAPVRAVIPVPDEVPSEAAVLVEPFAAALHAVTTCAPHPGDTVAVLGPRRLGLLVIAALAGHRQESGNDFRILALSRHPELLARARDFGATDGQLVVGDGGDLPDGLADVVLDTTGNPAGLELAIRLARREVHVKSTPGRPAAGLAHLTELVVDELWIAPLPDSPEPLLEATPRPKVAWLSAQPEPFWSSRVELLRGPDPAELLHRLEADAAPGALPRADFAVVDGVAAMDRVIRPEKEREVSLMRPRGGLLLHGGSQQGESPPRLEQAIRSRGLRLTSSRCGDFRQALHLMQSRPELRELGRKLVTHVFDIDSIEEAFETARSPACIKAVIHHGDER